MSETTYNVWVDGIKIYSDPMTFEWASQTAMLGRKIGFKQVLVDTDDLPLVHDGTRKSRANTAPEREREEDGTA